MSIFDGKDLEVGLPVRSFFGERCCAEAGFDPLHATVRKLPGGRHVVLVFTARDRSGP
jgi:hypothetical protein